MSFYSVISRIFSTKSQKKKEDFSKTKLTLNIKTLPKPVKLTEIDETDGFPIGI